MTTYKKPATQGLHIDFTYIDKLTDEPVFDVSIVKPTEVVKFERVRAGWMQPVSSIYSIPDSYIKHWTNVTYPPSCTLMDNYVRTYDMKTIHTPIEKGCSYILTTHCLEHKKFAIIATTDHLKPGTKKIIIYIGRHTIVLTPPQREKYVIKFDEKDHEVKILQPILFEEQELIYAVSNVAADKSYFVEIHAEKVGVIVTYDGKNVKTQPILAVSGPLLASNDPVGDSRDLNLEFGHTEVDTRYKGELCGLCSEFNGEIYREMRGPKRCLYTSSVDFTKSNIVGKCGNKEPQHPYICANKGNYEWSEEHTERLYKPTLKRNIVLYEEHRICFSKQAFPVCNRENSEVRTEMKTVDFHCLPKTEKVTKKLAIESERRILGEMETKSTDMSKEVEIATECSD
ncbi:vit-6 [Trichonephila clavipes]|nr:vit-6 [Trichonephila clavipes]